MEYQDITNLLGNTPDKVPRFITKKWIQVHDQSGIAENRYNPNKQIRFKTAMLRSDLYDYNDAYIVVEGDITVEGAQNRDKNNRNLGLTNDAPCISCISKINGALIDNAENLDVVMPMYNCLSIAKITQRHLALYGTITRMSQIIFLLIIIMQLP